MILSETACKSVCVSIKGFSVGFSAHPSRCKRACVKSEADLPAVCSQLTLYMQLTCFLIHDKSDAVYQHNAQAMH